MGFLVGEYLFEQMSSVKTRKHYVLADLGFSALWAFLFFVGFCYLTSQWGKAADPPGGYGVNNVQAAIVFSFFSIFTWVSVNYLILYELFVNNCVFYVCRPVVHSSLSNDSNKVLIQHSHLHTSLIHKRTLTQVIQLVMVIMISIRSHHSLVNNSNNVVEIFKRLLIKDVLTHDYKSDAFEWRR